MFMVILATLALTTTEPSVGEQNIPKAATTDGFDGIQIAAGTSGRKGDPKGAQDEGAASTSPADGSWSAIAEQNRAAARTLDAEFDQTKTQFVLLSADLQTARAKQAAINTELAALLALQERNGARFSDSVSAQVEREISELREDLANATAKTAQSERTLAGSAPGEGSWLRDKMENINNQRKNLDSQYHQIIAESQGATPARDGIRYSLNYFIDRLKERRGDLFNSMAAEFVVPTSGLDPVKRAQYEALQADLAVLEAMRDQADGEPEADAAIFDAFDNTVDQDFSFDLGPLKTSKDVRDGWAKFEDIYDRVQAASDSLADLAHNLEAQQRVVEAEVADLRALAATATVSERARLTAEADRLRGAALKFQQRADQASLDTATLRASLKREGERLDAALKRDAARRTAVADAELERKIVALGDLDDVMSGFEDAKDAPVEPVADAPRRHAVVSFVEAALPGTDGRPLVFWGDAANDDTFGDATDDADIDGAAASDPVDEFEAVFASVDVNRILVPVAEPGADIVLRRIESAPSSLDAQPQRWQVVTDDDTDDDDAPRSYEGSFAEIRDALLSDAQTLGVDVPEKLTTLKDLARLSRALIPALEQSAAQLKNERRVLVSLFTRSLYADDNDGDTELLLAQLKTMNTKISIIDEKLESLNRNVLMRL